MNQAYSNKALPEGTVLREWRLEEVIGVGGFGIVYRGRGIYFDELVAIKEYFPSAISERAEDDTVVPVDSDAEEVHALGLKKFVEEAKLLWNLSSPTRHPNIVSVRSLFEIHGTAYMVMDFEDGHSLSKQLKDGKTFDEESLSAMILPIAQGLERAHRVGVLHRDIKPANIIVHDDGNAVLIDFGSARFESGDATSTKVTFHTPPYAAIEQYVKTYDQGPWTDIYALGVVLYQCITGKKPPEVLERMHGEEGEALADGDWPGYSKGFLAAVDTAMTIRPGDRPQSVGEWLLHFGDAPLPKTDEGDPTRVAPMAEDVGDITPVHGDMGPDVPEKPEAATFKMASGETRAGIYSEEEALAPEPEDTGATQATEASQAPPEDAKDAMSTDSVDEAIAANAQKREWKKEPALPWPVEGEKAGQAAVAKARGKVVEDAATDTSDHAPKKEDAATPVAAKSKPKGGSKEGVETPKKEGAKKPWLIPAIVVGLLALVGAVIFWPSSEPTLVGSDDPVDPLDEGMEEVFAGTTNELGVDEDFATGAEEEDVAEATALPETPSQSQREVSAETPATARTPDTPAPPASTFATSPAAPAATPSGPRPVTSAQRSRLAAIVREGEGLANEVQRMAQGRRPGRRASDEERAGYDTRRANAERAQGYEDYLGTLSNSMRGVDTGAEADRLIRQAEQTRQYLVFLRNNSAGTAR